MLQLKDLAEEMDMQFDEVDKFVHKKTGDFVYLETEYYALAEAVDDGEKGLTECQDWEREAVAEIIKYWEHLEDYASLSNRYEINEYGMMEDFIDQLSNDMMQNCLEQAIHGKGAFRYFKDTIEELGISQGWYDFKAQAMLEIAKEWCEDQGIAYQQKGANK